MANVVFDLDGTLIDSARDLHSAVAKMLEEEGLAPLDLATVQRFIGNGVPMLIQRVMEHCFGAVEAFRHQKLLARFMHHYNAAPTALTRLYPYVAECLHILCLEGHRLAVCTNKPHAISRTILEELEVAQHFSAVFGGDTLPVKKPDPAPLLATAAALGPAPTLYVGDSEIDSETADRAGFPFLLFTEGYRKKPITAIPHLANFNDFRDLPRIIAAVIGEKAEALRT
jgi:phosphoglycolate phosphatase